MQVLWGYCIYLPYLINSSVLQCVYNKQRRKNTDNNKERRKEVGGLETE